MSEAAARVEAGSSFLIESVKAKTALPPLSAEARWTLAQFISTAIEDDKGHGREKLKLEKQICRPCCAPAGC